MNKQLTTDIASRLNSIVAMGVNLPDAAKRMEVTKKQVVAWCDELNIDCPKPVPTQTDKLNARKEQIVKAYREGETVKSIAERMGFTETITRTTIARWGVKRVYNREEIYKKICAMRINGSTYAEIIKALNVKQSLIQRALDKHRIVVPTSMTRFIEVKDEAMKLYWDGETLLKIAKKYDIKAPWVSKQFKAWGAKRAWDKVEASMDKCAVRGVNGEAIDIDPDELFFIQRASSRHQVLMHWREYERLKKLAGEEI